MIQEQQKLINRKKNSNTKYQATIDIFSLFGVTKFPYPSKVSFLPLINYWESKLKSENKVEQLIANEIHDLLKQKGEYLRSPVEDLKTLEGLDDLVKLLISLYFPYQDKNTLLRITGPFNTLPFYHSSSLIKTLSNHTIKTNLDKEPEKIYKQIIYRAGSMILNQFYSQQLQYDTPYVVSITGKKTGLERHFRTKFDSRFAEVIPLKPLKKLTDTQIHELLSHVDDTDLWLKYLPPSNFEFQGIFCTLLTDISISETLSRLKVKLLQRDALLSEEKIRLLEKDLCTFFGQSDLKLGVCTVDYRQVSGISKKYSINYGLINDRYPNLLSPKNGDSIYWKVAESNKFMTVENLAEYDEPTPIESELLTRGIKNILVAPLTNKDQQVIGLFELGSPRPYQLTSLTALKLEGIISLFNVAIERSQTEVEHQIQSIIREYFTSIHPSIEWAFIKNAFEILKREEEGDTIDFSEDQFVFRDNYPLYGQADIVSSTVTRNKAIQADLIENLYEIKKLLNLSNKHYSFPLTGQISQEVDSHIDQLKRGITSNSEYAVMEFIRKEVHPLLRYLKKKNPEVQKAFKKYTNYLDPQMATVFNKRKDYEKSVARVNKVISAYLDEQQELAQEMCPHYYEKFQTDGVAYNIYIGQSLLRKGKLTPFHLKNLRLWQLIGMCEITRKIEDLQAELPTPLNTAQLIFVHSTPLSIRFRMDEKRFDVDGAYNARYEILKKRIDKAVVEGTNERLTLKGKVAIVYQQEKDRKEYLRYLKYLIKIGYIEKKIEELPLKKMQGVQGLKALRVTVRLNAKE